MGKLLCPSMMCANLGHLEKENELNDCINEMVEFNDQIHYVKEIKDKYKK